MSNIGSERGTARELFENFGLAPFRKIMPSADFSALAAANDCAPKRARPLTPEVVVWLMMAVAVQTTSMNQGLGLAWGWMALAGFVLRRSCCVTEEAFCQAREALPLRFWRALWTCLRHKFEQRFDSALRWKGLRVLAADGTEADVPNVPRLVRFFTRPRTKLGESKAPQGRLVAVCSALTGFCVDFTFTSRRFSEHLALRHLIRRLRAQDLLLLDRGFFSYAAIHAIPLQKADFLLRVPSNVVRYARLVRTLGDDDSLVEFCPSDNVRRENPQLPKTLLCRLIRYELPGFRPSWLLTSLLDVQAFPTAELVHLYHWRWRIETIYREWKHGLKIENLRSHTPAGIQKEMFAHLLLSNLVRFVMTEAAEGSGKTPLEFSFLDALTSVKNTIAAMSQRNAPILALYQILLADIRSAPIRQRPGRSYPRPGEGKYKKRPNGVLRLPARLVPLT